MRGGACVAAVLLTAPAGAGCVAHHAVVSRRHAREVAHRWRPLPVAVDDLVLERSSPDAMQRYVRTVIACEDARVFGVLQQRRGAGLSLFVVARTAHDAYAVRSCLTTSADPRDLSDTVRELRAWYADLLPGARLVCDDPHAAKGWSG